MFNRKYLPSLGFVVLISTIICGILFIRWALSPLDFEKAKYEERLGNKLVSKGKNKDALRHFLTAARIKDDNVSTSRRYRLAANASSNEDMKIKHYKLSLRYNKNNKNAKEGLKKLSSEIRYNNRYEDGWSKGKKCSIKIDTKEESAKYELVYFTKNPGNNRNIVEIYIDQKLYEKKRVSMGNFYKTMIILPKGRHRIDISISQTFNPRLLGLSEDNRDLGIYIEVKKPKVGNE